MISACSMDLLQWMVEEGMRRGGRKLSKRMSELLGIFGEGEKDRVVGPNTGGTVSEDYLSSFSLISSLSLVKDNTLLSSRKSKTISNCNIERVRSKLLFRGDRTLLVGCDWPVDSTSSKLTTNGRTVGKKRKQCGDMESERQISTKKWRGDSSPN